MIITQFTNLQIILTPGKNLAFADLLSGIVSLKDLKKHQLAHKEIPKDIRFFNQSGHEVQYLIDRNSYADDGNVDFYPIVCTHLGETKALHLKRYGSEMVCTIFESKSPKAFLMFLIFSEKARTLTVDENGKLYQLLRNPNFMKTITQKLNLIVKSVTMRRPMRTLF